MAKLWEGRFSKALDSKAEAFNDSIGFDQRMWRQDILGSIAHATMLKKQQIITASDADLIIKGLQGLFDDLESGKAAVDTSFEDIHSYVEAELSNRIGTAAKCLHTARSRNDQVALDFRMNLMDEMSVIQDELGQLITALLTKAAENQDALMPGYTHLQRAQPITYAHYLLSYANMFERDKVRAKAAFDSADCCPLGSAALAGTSFPIDRHATAEALGFSKISSNSIDGVSDRDFALDALYCLSVIQMHLSRFCEEIILHCSWEFHFITLDDSVCTGSSIMPQKKNPDLAELTRGKTGRVYGNLISLLTVLKGLPLAYNKDMQEDKEGVFDSLDTVHNCIGVTVSMIKGITVNKAAMKQAAQAGFINATDCADYLAQKGLPFREAYKITGQLVKYSIEQSKTLETLTLDEYKSFSQIFDQDIFDAVDMLNCLKKRTSEGGTSPQSVAAQLEIWKNKGYSF